MKNVWALTAVLAACLSTGCATSSGETAPAVSNEGLAVSPEEAALFAYLQEQNTTGFIVVRDGDTLIEQNWPAPNTASFRLFQYGPAPDGSLYEDVASQQKSFIAVLVGIAVDKGLIDVEQSVSHYLGAGWSEADAVEEAAIKVIHVLQMNSGLGEDFYYEDVPGTTFLYNTPVYAVSKDILTAASGLSLEQLTTDWLTVPAGMADTAWRQRPAALANVGNPTGLVTTPTDTARFGQMILNGGISVTGARVISEESLNKMFERSAPNPAYGRLWWLNGSDFTLSALGRREGPLIVEAPEDLVAALGFLDRRLYVVPSLNLVVARTGADAPDKDFDNQVWRLLKPVLDR